MTDTLIDQEAAWAAFSARDRASDGRFVGAVRTTGIYCKPSCPARHPKRENVTFYRDAAEARAAGYRACLRCKPDEVGRDRIAVANAVALIEAAEEAISLEQLAAEVGYAPHHFHRLFKRATGVTPAAYARGLRATRVAMALKDEATVTGAIYEAGYSAPSRFYDSGAKRLGMTPSAWRKGGAGVTVRWTIADTSLGKLLIAATDKGLCRVAFDEDALALARHFPKAEIVSGGAALAELAARVVATVESPDRDHDLPIDVQGTAFQEAVWQALRAIPAGETRSYAELAAAAGNPKAVRAVGSACGANHVAVVVPCHRAQRSDGSIGGYAYGVERKVALLAREGAK
ncbi:bifunctional DNA-binding transcriptional regulator/O6-methylguanine-DNA methyltransferase Ada [Sphingomonas sp.]|jgi:AraC family transcriptional regulator of adaptative response/methylated-DNA-[protein]-cysteine methyltransferase|uniref:bifunctional DNA-binding transcriptional regulator/O6-methylguanine-DNA methyltransferase Ada n=1 Tax=Sphingomonas sp. TaxID=28214 RepID=UPI002E3755A7|nr:bifunctional DNA-binding transcriptional regulator/O6-methylguanine-DNA methyltransferase Ada [Sphingomonas sp.]HEX4693341.1 bifunctional DNA-binding transcriptional regulator/O6-methylguanine-DNA methyltransferase Ada [Sphingomonas sp.]